MLFNRYCQTHSHILLCKGNELGVMYMTLCPNCGNTYSEIEKYCPCCGTATMQPIWVTQSSNKPLGGSIDESFLEDSISDDSDSLLNSPLDSMKSNSSYYDPVETDIFDDVADSASSLYSNMSPKVKKIVLSLIVGTLLSLIPIIYAACSHIISPTAGTYVQSSTSTAGAIFSPSGSTASGAK